MEEKVVWLGWDGFSAPATIQQLTPDSRRPWRIVFVGKLSRKIGGNKSTWDKSHFMSICPHNGGNSKYMKLVKGYWHTFSIVKQPQWKHIPNYLSEDKLTTSSPPHLNRSIIYLSSRCMKKWSRPEFEAQHGKQKDG